MKSRIGYRKPEALLAAFLFFLPMAWAAEPSLPFALTQTGSLDPKMQAVQGLAFDSRDLLYVAGTPGVKVFDGSGNLQRTLQTSAPARCVAVDEQGFVYAGQHARIEKFDPDGNRVAQWGEEGKAPGELQSVDSIAAGGPTVYVADGGARKLNRFAADGDFIDDHGGFLAPSGHLDLAVDSTGVLYVAHSGKHQIERYGPNWKLLGQWGEFGLAPEKFCGCCNPTNLALFADGRVATTEKGIPRLKVYDASGRLLAHLGGETFPPDAESMDLAIDSKQRIALADPIGRQIRFFEMKPTR